MALVVSCGLCSVDSEALRRVGRAIQLMVLHNVVDRRLVYVDLSIDARLKADIVGSHTLLIDVACRSRIRVL